MGGSQNSLDDQKTKEEMRKLKLSARNIAVTHDDNPPGGLVLHLMGSLFWVSGHKTNGTKIMYDPTDDRNSTSYSGT